MCNTASPAPKKITSVLHSSGPTSRVRAAAAVTVMRETSSAPATHTSTRATLSERTPPRGRSWRCSHPSMEITDMWVNLNFYNLNYFHFPISQSKVNVWPPHFSLKLSILVDLTYIFAQLDFYSALSFKLPT